MNTNHRKAMNDTSETRIQDPRHSAVHPPAAGSPPSNRVSSPGGLPAPVQTLRILGRWSPTSSRRLANLLLIGGLAGSAAISNASEADLELVSLGPVAPIILATGSSPEVLEFAIRNHGPDRVGDLISLPPLAGGTIPRYHNVPMQLVLSSNDILGDADDRPIGKSVAPLFLEPGQQSTMVSYGDPGVRIPRMPTGDYWLFGTLSADIDPRTDDNTARMEQKVRVVDSLPPSALMLDGQDDYAIAQGTVYPRTKKLESFTVEMWILPRSRAGNWVVTDDAYDLQQMGGADGRALQFRLWAGDGSAIRADAVQRKAAVGIGVWNHVAFMYDSQAHAYTYSLNGHLGGWLTLDKETFRDFDADPIDFTLGGLSGGLQDLFEGYLDEVRISSVVRYRKDFAPLPRFHADGDTEALYHFDEEPGETQLHDSSGNEWHLQAANGAATAQPPRLIQPRLENIAPGKTGVCVSVITESDKHYILEAQSGVSPSGWIEAASADGTGNEIVLCDGAGLADHRFYRLRVDLPRR